MIKKIARYRNEGWLALWKGIVSELRTIIEALIKFISLKRVINIMYYQHVVNHHAAYAARSPTFHLPFS